MRARNLFRARLTGSATDGGWYYFPGSAEAFAFLSRYGGSGYVLERVHGGRWRLEKEHRK